MVCLAALPQKLFAARDDPFCKFWDSLPSACARFEYLKVGVEHACLFVQCRHVEIRVKRKIVGFGYDECIHYREHGRILVHLVMPFGNRKQHDAFVRTGVEL